MTSFDFDPIVHPARRRHPCLDCAALRALLAQQVRELVALRRARDELARAMQERADTLASILWRHPVTVPFVAAAWLAKRVVRWWRRRGRASRSAA